MSELVYVPWEPGVSGAEALETYPLMARRVERVPEVGEVSSEAAAAWFERPEIANLISSSDHSAADPATRVAILCDERHLFVAFECFEPDFASRFRLIPKDAANGELIVSSELLPRVLDNDDHVSVRLDASHEHEASVWFQVNLNGARRVTRVSSAMSWAALPVNGAQMPVETSVWESRVQEFADRWRCAMKIELRALGVNPAVQPTIGIALGRARYGACLRHFVSSPTLHLHFTSPLAFNDLYLADNGITVRKIDWPARGVGENRLSVLVQSRTESRDVRLVAQVRGVRTVSFESARTTIPAGQSAVAEVSYEMPHDFDQAALVLELRDAAGGQVLFKGSLPMGVASRLYTPRVCRDSRAENPAPTDPEFHAKKMQYILTRVPRFVRRNTAQGAASDFTLQSIDGKVSFDLMKAGAMDRIGRWIDSLFDNPIDRLIAAVLFANDNSVSTHCAARVGMHNHLTPLSAIRLGAGHCYSRAMAGAGIVAAVTNPQTGKRFEAYPCLIVGHVIVAVRWRDSFTFVDPTFGDFFFNKGNTDLATDRELAADHALISRATAHSRAVATYGHPEWHTRFEHGTIVWPAGAPPK